MGLNVPKGTCRSTTWRGLQMASVSTLGSCSKTTDTSRNVADLYGLRGGGLRLPFQDSLPWWAFEVVS